MNTFLTLDTVCLQDANAKLNRQLEAAKKQEQELRTQLLSLESRRADQERLLEGASSQIDGLRREVQLLTARQAARDQKLLRHVEVSVIVLMAGVCFILPYTS